jgi:hypothetical protein
MQKVSKETTKYDYSNYCSGNYRLDLYESQNSHARQVHPVYLMQVASRSGHSAIHSA